MSSRHRFLIVTAMLVGIAITGRAQNSSIQTPIDAARMTAHIKILSADDFEGRAPASAAEPKVVDYIVQQMTAAGLKPGGKPDADGVRAWTQDVPLEQADIDGPLTATLTAGGMSKTLRQGEQIAVRATMLPTPRVTIENAPLVFLGYGVAAAERQWDDFKGVDLRGKIGIVLINDPDFEADLRGRFDGKAMTYYGRWTYKFAEAASRGALGLLVVHETAPASYGWATVKNSNNTTMFDIVRADPSTVHPPLEAWIQRDVAVDLFRASGLDFEAEKKKAQSAAFRPVSLGNASLSVAYAVKQTQVVSKNIVGRIDGSRRPDETIIYTAHWDHLGIGLPDDTGDRIYNGARDNALGTASLLELARVHAMGPPPERSIVFLSLTAEEKGLLGSEYYAQHPLYPVEKTVAVYNMDGGTTWGLANDVAIAGDGKISLQRDLAAAARRQGREFSPDPRPEAGSFFRSDHFSFAKVGVPAISFRSGLNLVKGGVAEGKRLNDEYTEKRYHQPSDEWNASWDLSGAAVDTGLLYTVGREMANSRRWPEWEQGSEFKALRDKTAAARR
jgi:Zn-dependent M28 family amino/carboxypeptidase